MVSLRLASLLLGLLLISQTLLSSSIDYEGWKIRGSWLKENGGNTPFIQKDELVDGISAKEIGKGVQVLVGRKMGAAKNRLKKERVESIGESSISQRTGKEKNASMESLQRPQNLLHNQLQNNEERVEIRALLESQSPGNENQQYLKASTKAKLELEGSLLNYSKNDEEEKWEQRVLKEDEEADKKVEELMRRDYDHGMKKPRRRPPVNNNEPNH